MHGKKKPCPNCRVKQPKYFPDNKSKREIRFLRVKCHNAEHACTWEGTVGTVEEHVATECQFTLLPCPNQCKDHSNKTNHYMRKDVDDHLKKYCPNRGYICQDCGKEGTYATITAVHDTLCQKKIVPCTNTGCCKTLQRQHISQHVQSKCEYTVVACKHKSIGCETELKRKDMAAHEMDDKLHLHMAINTITMMQKDIVLLKENATQSKEDVTRLETELKKVTTKSKELETQLETTTQSVIQFRKTPSKEHDSVNFKFLHYKERKVKEAEFIYSSFYTSHGYHMALRVDANGYSEGKGTHLSVFVLILEGKQDSYLSWPFLGTITITLLNQLEDANHHSMAISIVSKHNTRVGSGQGSSKFIRQSALGHNPTKNMQYLKDDTLYFRVEVKVEAGKPWLQQCTTNII